MESLEGEVGDGGQVAVAGGPFEGVPGEAADLWCCLLLFLLGV